MTPLKLCLLYRRLTHCYRHCCNQKKSQSLLTILILSCLLLDTSHICGGKWCMLESDIQRAGSHTRQQRGLWPCIYRYIFCIRCCLAAVMASVWTDYNPHCEQKQCTYQCIYMCWLGRHQLAYFLLLLADYHIVADGYGGKGYLVGREDEDRLSDIIKQAQKESREGKAVLLNVMIGKTNFREGSISV